MSWTNIKTAYLSVSGSIGTPPLRLRGLYVISKATQGVVSISDESAELMKFDVLTSVHDYIKLPDAGIRFVSACSITGPAGTVFTFFYD